MWLSSRLESVTFDDVGMEKTLDPARNRTEAREIEVEENIVEFVSEEG